MDRVSKAERELVRKMQRTTNYDRIISKTPEELAEYFRVVVDCEFCPVVVSTSECTDGKYCMERWIDWLKQEERE